MDAAGIRADSARTDYSAASRYLRSRELAGWGALRVLVPAERQPHTVAAFALARHTDDLCDRGPVEGRAARFDEWVAQVKAALDSGDSEHPLIRAYLRSAEALSLSRDWIDAYMAGARFDLGFPGFAEEADYQRYIDTVALPVLMFVTQAMPRVVPEHCFTSSARLVADGTQRTDFLTDLFEDLQDGRLNLPADDLGRYRVTLTDLRGGKDTEGVRALISATANSARVTLGESERILSEIAPKYRPFWRCAIGGAQMHLDVVEATGAAVIRHAYRDGPVALVRLLMRSVRLGASTRALRKTR